MNYSCTLLVLECEALHGACSLLLVHSLGGAEGTAYCIELELHEFVTAAPRWNQCQFTDTDTMCYKSLAHII